LNVVDQPNKGSLVIEDGTWNVNRSYRMSTATQLQSHSVFCSGDARSKNRRRWMDPGDTAVQSAIFFVKRHQFDVVRFESNYQ
jgi:hypothetical protein